MQDTTELITLEGTMVRISLPENYDRGNQRRFPLLLVLDEGIAAPEWTGRLHAEGVLPEMIVATVGLSPSPPDPVRIVDELALTVGLRLLESPDARWLVGSGHSAVDVLRCALDHPHLFGRAACLSTSFEGTEGAPPLHSPMLRHLEERADIPVNSRLYFDYGTVGLDECYEPYHRDLGSILRTKGWRDGKEFLISRVSGGTHDLISWQARLGPALRWLAGR